jgi:hypothetical protein
MWKDPIVEEIHKIRAKMAKEVNYDVHQLIENMRKREKESNAKVVSREGEQLRLNNFRSPAAESDNREKK